MKAGVIRVHARLACFDELRIGLPSREGTACFVPRRGSNLLATESQLCYDRRASSGVSYSGQRG